MNKQTKEFLNYLQYEKLYSIKTIDSYSRDIEKFYAFLLEEDIDYDKVDAIVIRNFLTKELTSGVTKRSCKRRLSALRQYYKFLIRNRYIEDDPFIYINTPKVEKRYPRVLFKEQVLEILNENRKRTDEFVYRDQAILDLLYYSGLRASELVNLSIQDVQLKQRIIRVIGKGNKERIVPISEESKSDIEKYIKLTRTQLLKKTKEPHANLILNNRGNPLTVRGLEYILDKIEEKTGTFVNLHPHILRHSFATNLIENGADIRVIQELLGHTSINATQVYTHVSDKSMSETYNNFFPRAHKK